MDNLAEMKNIWAGQIEGLYTYDGNTGNGEQGKISRCPFFGSRLMYSRFDGVGGFKIVIRVLGLEVMNLKQISNPI